ncbi:trypsin-like peptidase domain-containing protein [Polaribacter sargassicola]|uniref:trypsin-like peptidase domain-containing protein n=1 Tax=Polaribacter sargassicola TaxID=2836891 RepID=UPI001F34B10A|nr:trypsin-like peptidase domain-containing protein [Polaribacter sp. DS7-9]MCG1037170.1 trypsin-like peptidase domain-containing protein [Polaribacter sp. DS7-9]
MKKFFGLVGMAALGGVLTLGGYKMLFNNEVVVERTISQPIKTITANYNPVLDKVNSVANSIDFTVAAENSVHAVVHVKNTAIRTQTNPWAELFYGGGSGTRKYEQVGTGSGVIISPDGYIVTNNHVIDGASELEVTLNNQHKLKAELIGTDTENDIALLKIDTDIDLPYIPFADSDNIKIGEWVLAVGNPYNLTSTVTAGIVSAKGRDLEGNTAIDSFIQTDAAVNPGNSGGALVNSKGELVGINTAISSKTGSFVGYSFAVPSNIAKKIVDDLIEFGKVQQAILGITVDTRYQEEGVKVAGVTEEVEGAKKSGLKAGDIIKKVNSVKITKFSDLKGQLTAKRPGEFVNVTIDRDGETLVKKVELSKSIERYISSVFQWELKDLSKDEIKKKDISKGVKIIRTGKDEDEENLKNYIITKINNKEVGSAKETAQLLDNLVSNRYRVAIEMINLDGEIERYIYR